MNTPQLNRQIILDTETTGMNTAGGPVYLGHRIIEIGCVEVINRKLTGNHYHVYIKPDRLVDTEAIQVHGITDEFLRDKPSFSQIADEFLDFIRGAELIAHNAPFDVSFMDYEFSKLGLNFKTADICTITDTLAMARDLFPGKRNNLDVLCDRYGIDNSHRTLHGALLDAEILADVYLLMTGGQTKLNLATESNENESNQDTSIRRLESNRPALKVVRASTEVQALHEARLDLVQKKGRKLSVAAMSKWCAGLLLLLSLGATATEVFAPSDIPLLDNRFRIDYGVKEITFIIKRKPGTPSVILVRPDGSKLYVGKVKPADVGWLALPEHDLITLRNPMPGPWQAIGEVDPDNRVRILSDIRLDIAALPMQLYQGEVVKLKAWLLINGQPPKDKYYLSDLGMTVKLQSFSDADKKEVVLDQVLGHYRDDGKGLDEVPGDGIMTAEVTLQDIPGGKYRAMFSTGNQVFVRARYQDVLLYPYPFSYNLAPPSDELGAKLSLLIDRDELDPASVVVKGSVTSNVGGLYEFSETASDPKLDIDLSNIKEVGQHEVKATLYGTTRLGRELKIELPVKTFNVFPPPPPPVEVVSAAAPASSAEATHEAPAEEEMGWLIWALAGGGVLLAVLCGVGFVVIQKRRALKRALAAAQAENQQAGQPAAKLDLNLPEQ